MDANGTRYHLLLGEEDWASCTDVTHVHGPVLLYVAWHASPEGSNSAALAWDEARHELILQPRLLSSAQTQKEYPLSMRRGAGRDRYGNWFWISETGQELLVNSVGTGTTSHFWSADDSGGCLASAPTGSFQPVQTTPPPTLLRFGGLAVTEDHYLVVGRVDQSGLLIGLLIFDLHAGDAPSQMDWPQNVRGEPIDMASMPGGGVWILDFDPGSKLYRYWALDRHFDVIPPGRSGASSSPAQPDIFKPGDGNHAVDQQRTVIHAGTIALDAAFPLFDVQQAIAIEALPDGTVLILDRNPEQDFSLIYRYSLEGKLGDPASTQVMKSQIEPDQAKYFRLRAYDFAFVPEHDGPDGKIPDLLYIVAEDGAQSYAFTLTLKANQQIDMQPQIDYLPMRLFGGKGLVATATQAYYDFSDQWIPLVRQPRPRYKTEAILLTPMEMPEQVLARLTPDDSNVAEASRVTALRPALDGRVPDCVWHRLMLDACIPSGAQVQVWSRASNDAGDFARMGEWGWQQEPPLYLRGDGSELPHAPRPKAANSGTWELLLQHAEGRYLQIKLVLTGNGRTTPRIRAMRIYYPRFSYLEHYLPAVYREDSVSASFLDRFLANIEGFSTTIEDKIANVHAYFTVAGAPLEALEWLANWFGIALDPSWSEAKQRLFLSHVMDFFRLRGTNRGLRMALRLSLEDDPDETIFTDTADAPGGIRIVEQYVTRYAPAVVYGDPTDAIQLLEEVQSPRWTPTQGEAILTDRYRAFLQQHGQDSSKVAGFPLIAPLDTGIRTLWQQFAQDALGFVPRAQPDNVYHQSLWQNFLRRNYQTVSALNGVYQASDFGKVPLFTTVPSASVRLRDWYQFESIVMAMYGTAHHFTVLLPYVGAETNAEQQRRRSLAERIVNLEKPAHTTFEVKFYWALFCVGEARLGEDTLIGKGGRAPELMSAMVLGRGYLSESYMGADHPQDVKERSILGRDVLND